MGGGDWEERSGPEEEEEEEEEEAARGGVSVNVRCTDGTSFAVDAAEGSTVAALKEAVAGRSGIPAAQQRLIYKGRILVDGQTLESYGVQSDHTIHLVRGAAISPSFTTSVPASTPTTTQAPASRVDTQAQGSVGSPGLTGSEGSGGAGLGGPLFPELGATGRGLFGTGIPDLDQMQQYLGQNPNMMREIMNMPIIQNIMNNPEVLRNLIMNNPQMREVVDRNPDLAHVLNDPNILRQTLEAARSPELMREMMRNTDRAMSNIESSPEGFNMLRRMYETVQEPFLNAAMVGNSGNGSGANPLAAVFGGLGARNAQDRSSSPSRMASEELNGSPTPNSSPLPNPWGNADAGNEQADNNTRSNQSPATNARAPGTAGIGLQGFPELERIFGGPDGSSLISQLVQNPALAQAMQSIFSNPQFMNQSSNQIRELLQSSELLRQLASPETFQLFQPLQQWFSSLARPPGGQDVNQNGNTRSAGAPNVGLDFWMNLLGGVVGGGGTGVGNPPAAPPEELYAAQLSQLREMGFTDTRENIRALSATSGNVHAAVERLLGNPGS